MKKEYTIGEAANILGVSRDTLRIYEQKALINPHRDASGYRKYNEEDIYRFIFIKFHRSNMVPLNEIKDLLGLKADIELKTIKDVIKRRIEEEQNEINVRLKNQERLKLSLLYYDAKSCNRYEVSENICYTVSEKRKDFSETLRDYFEYSSKDPDFGLCYLTAEFDADASLKAPAKSYLILKEHELKSLKRYDLMLPENRTHYEKCLIKRVLSESPTPCERELLKMKRAVCKYSGEIKPSRRPSAMSAEKVSPKASPSSPQKGTGSLSISSHFIYRTEKEGRAMYLLELCAPLLS